MVCIFFENFSAKLLSGFSAASIFTSFLLPKQSAVLVYAVMCVCC